MLKTVLSEEIYQYAVDFGVREHPVLAKLRNETANLSNAQMQISVDQGQLMGLLAKMIGAKRYLELGVFTGYSSLNMALAMGSDGHVTGLELNTKHLITSSCAKLIADKEQFDIAFIDANKTDYPAYYEYCYQLVRVGGLVLVDNVLFKGAVLEEHPSNSTLAIKKLNEIIKNDPRVDICMLPIADGLTIAYKKGA